MTYQELKNLLIEANNAYYIKSQPIMSDYEFDMKLKELEKLEQSQGYADPDSPTQKPGNDTTDSNLNENNHKRPMLSLENTYNQDEIRKWYDDMIKVTGDPAPEVVVNPKWDGGSGAIRYENGLVYRALTRGTGEVGEDITQNVKYLDDNIWPNKKSYMIPFTGEARGEIIMTTDGFEGLNKNNEYQNARNLVAGSMKLLNIYDFIPRAESIKFYAYWLEDSDNDTYAGDLMTLKAYNFTVGDYYICHNFEEIVDAINKIENTEFDVAIDGAVMKLNKKAYWKVLGSTAKFPRWAKAYKYKQESVETVVKNITFEIGRTGKITPLCWFEPKFIDGSTIEKATLNNKEFYEAMDVAIGDTIKVQKAAAIIPQIIEVVERPGNRVHIEFPTTCPNCGCKLVKHNDEHADWYCDNSNCSSRVIDQIINYTHMLEINGFAEVIVERLYNMKLLTSIADLYTLKNHKEEIAQLDRLSLNIAEKLVSNIEGGKTAKFWRLLAALGIPNIGPKTAKILAKHYKTMDALRNTTLIELTSLEGIAELTANEIISWFSIQGNIELLAVLKSEGQNMSVEEKQNQSSISLNGKSFCITGSLAEPRSKYVALIESIGGKVLSSVSTKTSYLVTNDKTSGSSKNKAAQKFNIPIINEEELLKLCNIALEDLRSMK